MEFPITRKFPFLFSKDILHVFPNLMYSNSCDDMEERIYIICICGSEIGVSLRARTSKINLIGLSSDFDHDSGIRASAEGRVKGSKDKWQR